VAGLVDNWEPTYLGALVELFILFVLLYWLDKNTPERKEPPHISRAEYFRLKREREEQDKRQGSLPRLK
jgi:hypothetical protein